MSTNANRSYRWLLWALAGLGFVLDQAGKYGVFALLQQRAAASPDLTTEQTVIPGALCFHIRVTGEKFAPDASPLRSWSGEYQPHVNRGAFLGFGGGNDEAANGNLIFTIVSVAAALAIVWWSTRRSISRDGLLCIALGLILGGTLGNLYDRIVFDGVRDYLYWFFLIPSAVFNVADFFLICGALLLLTQAFLGKSSRHEESGGEAERVTANGPQIAEAR